MTVAAPGSAEEWAQLFADIKALSTTHARMETHLAALSNDQKDIRHSVKDIQGKLGVDRSPGPSTNADCLLSLNSEEKEKGVQEEDAGGVTATLSSISRHSNLKARLALDDNMHKPVTPQRSSSTDDLPRRTVSTPTRKLENIFIADSLPLDWPMTVSMRSWVAKEREESRTGSKLRGSFRAQQTMAATKEEDDLMQGEPTAPVDGCVINPNSKTHMIYSSLSLVILIFDLTLLPYALAWDIDFTGWLQVAALLTPCFWTFDIFMNLITGIYLDGELVMTLRRIRRNYLRTWAAPDCLVVFCDWLSLIIGEVAGDSGNQSRSLKMLRFTKLGRLLRIMGMMRMLRVVRILEEFADMYLTEGYRLMFRMVNYIICIMWVAHLLCCIWFAIGKNAPTDTGMRWVDVDYLVKYGTFLESDELYQYCTSFHWAAGQIALGGLDVYPTNSVERIVFVLSMMFGLLFGSSLVSTMSAAMMDYQLMHKEKSTKLRLLRQYLRENQVASYIAVSVQKQVELRLNQKETLTEHDVPALDLLSSILRMQLRFEIQRPMIICHPIFRLWVSLDLDVMMRICMKAVDFKSVQEHDEIFLDGVQCSEAWAIVTGRVLYTQQPETSAVEDVVSVTAMPGQWLAEVALWCDWTHVGKAEASDNLTVLRVGAEQLGEGLSHSPVIHSIAMEYCKQFHKRVVSAGPPASPWPTDLEVPYTDYCDLVVSMAQEAQVTIGLDAYAELTLSNRRLGKSTKALDKLKAEVNTAKSVVVVTGQGNIIRVVSIVAMRVERIDGAIFAQVGKYSGGQIQATCQLPGCKQERNELISESVDRLFNDKLPLLIGKVEFESTTRLNIEKESEEYQVMTRYMRSVCSARFIDGGYIEGAVCDQRDDITAVCARRSSMPMAARNRLSDISSGLQIMHRSTSIPATHSMAADDELMTRLKEKDVYLVGDSKSSSLYAWLSPDDFEFLSGKAGEALLAMWIAGLQVPKDFEEQQSLLSPTAVMLSDPNHGIGKSYSIDEDFPSRLQDADVVAI